MKKISLELCGLPANPKNEGISLVKTMKSKKIDKTAYALTTYGMNNHSIKTQNLRYIRYEDGKEELYDHKNDPNEFINQANNPNFKDKKEALKKYLPKTNAPWDKYSNYTFQPYFVEQKERTSGAKE